MLSPMLRLQAYKSQLIPTADQQRDVRCFAGARRFVFNKALGLETANHSGHAAGFALGYAAAALQTLIARTLFASLGSVPN